MSNNPSVTPIPDDPSTSSGQALSDALNALRDTPERDAEAAARGRNTFLRAAKRARRNTSAAKARRLAAIQRRAKMNADRIANMAEHPADSIWQTGR